MAKEFAFEQTFAQGAAIDLNEGTSVAIAEVVDGIGNDFLAGSCLAKQQNGRIAHRDSSSNAKNLLHCRA